MASNPHVHPVMRQALEASQPHLADTQLTEGNSFIEYRSKGTLEQVLKVITGVFRDFPAAGYSTKVTSIRQEGYADDSYVAIIWRARSCE